MSEALSRRSRLSLIAYELASTQGWSIEPAPAKRAWMDATFKKVAYRCLPLIAANQAGWIIRCPANFTAVWSGKPDNRAVAVHFEPDSVQFRTIAVSHFGSGILTFVLPWLFRTSPGFGLLLRGLTNEPKRSAVALDAVVETDWSPYSFTMNWQLQESGVPVQFKKGDAVCLLQPFALDVLERFDCSFEPLTAAPRELQRGFEDFVRRRAEGIAVAPQGQYETERDYFAGRYPDGVPAFYAREPQPSGDAPGHEVGAIDAAEGPQHRRSFELKPFTRTG